MTHDIVDTIDALVDAQLEQEASGYDHNLAQSWCPHCGRDWHGLAITKRLEQMRAQFQRQQQWHHMAQMMGLGEVGEQGYAESVVDPDYRYTEDDSPVLCPGSAFIGPRAPTAAERQWAAVTASAAALQHQWSRMFDESVAAIFGQTMPWQHNLLRVAVGDRIGYDGGDGVVHVSEATAEDVATIRSAAAPDSAVLRTIDLLNGGMSGAVQTDRDEQIPRLRHGAALAAVSEFVGARDDAPYVWHGGRGGDYQLSIGEPRRRPAPDPAPEPPDGRPPVPRPSPRPPMWANTPQTQRRNRRNR